MANIKNNIMEMLKGKNNAELISIFNRYIEDSKTSDISTIGCNNNGDVAEWTELNGITTYEIMYVLTMHECDYVANNHYFVAAKGFLYSDDDVWTLLKKADIFDDMIEYIEWSVQDDAMIEVLFS